MGVPKKDQYDNIGQHTLRGIEFLDKYSSFLKERCSIESEYASRLRKLVKNHQPKKKEEDDKFSSSIAFVKMLTEINDIAGQHELILETYSGHIMKEISDLMRELKEERKKHLHEAQKHQSNLQNSRYLLDKNKKSYEKSFKEAEKANDTFQKIDADINLSRADVEKARIHAQLKGRSCEESKTDYANQLQKTNELQRVHYTDLMPNIFQQLQDMEERRIACVQNVMKRTADIHRSILPIVQKCLDGIISAAEAINPREDSLLVIEKYKSGYDPPDDIPFEDLSNPRNGDLSNTLTSRTDVSTVKGTLSGGKNKKRGRILNIFSNAKNTIDEIKEDCSDLPPIQRKKKLQQKIDEIKQKIAQETNARDAIMKLKGVYENNPAMGDPASVEGQLADNGLKLEKLQNELQKYQGYMLDAEGNHGGSALSLSREHRSSLSDDSLSRSASDSSVCNPNGNLNYKISAPNTPQQTHGFSNSPESGIGTSQPSITDDMDNFPDPEFENEYEFNEEFSAVLGTGRALYPFTGQSEGSIDVCEGEEFDVVELDQGDGWTRVRKRNFEEGFVPTSYIETFLYNSC